MPKSFVITSASPNVTLDGENRGETSFSVTNSAVKSLQGEARLIPLRETKAEWLTVNGNKKRDFASTGSDQITVRIQPPAGVSPGKYSFRLNMVDVREPDEDFTEGPEVVFEIKTPTVAPTTTTTKFPIWIVFVALGVVLIGAVIAVVLMLPKKEPVPDVTNKSFLDASNLLAKAKFVVVREDDVTRSHTVGMVFAQTPTNGQKVKVGSTVTVTVEGQPLAVAVPDVTGIPLAKVKAMFDSKGLNYKVGAETITPAPRPLPPPGNITAVDPVAGTLVDVGYTVTLTVEGPSIAVPDLSNKFMTLQDAVNRLDTSKLGILRAEQKVVADPRAIDRVVGQEPAANTRVKPDTKVQVWLGVRAAIPLPLWKLQVQTNLVRMQTPVKVILR